MRSLIAVVLASTACSMGLEDLSGGQEPREEPPKDDEAAAATTTPAPSSPTTPTTPSAPTPGAPVNGIATAVVQTFFNANAFHHAQVLNAAEAGSGYVLESTTFRVLAAKPTEPHATLYRCRSKATSQVKGRFLSTSDVCEDPAVYEREATLGFVFTRAEDANVYGARPLSRCYRSRPMVMDHESRVDFAPSACGGELGAVQGYAFP